MKLSYNWLKDYVSISLSPEKLAHSYTMAGHEVEKIHNVDGDTVFEFEITPNRPDCLNILGLAREASAIFDKELKLPKIKTIKYPSKKVEVLVEDKQGCPLYTATVLENVVVGAGQKNLMNRLNAIGTRSINNVVDITNFVLMEMGQPLHAFDLDKLGGQKIVVRRAKAGESIVTIDGVERKLDPSILVIADAKKPVAIAGVMGGKETEVTANTKNILLESAYFDPILIRRASRKLALSSDSSYRFERGVDYQGVVCGAERAIHLIMDQAGGTVSKYTKLEKNKNSIKRPSINISVEKINESLGADLKSSFCLNVLKKLGFATKLAGKNKLVVTPPSSRLDVKAPVDIVEEVGRIVGYDKLPSSLPLIKPVNIPTLERRKRRNAIRQTILAQGLSEVITFTMISQKDLERSLLTSEGVVRVKNPLSKEQELMRPSMLPSLVNVVLNNVNKGQKDLQIFEIGKVYPAEGERETLGILLTGSAGLDWRGSKKKEISFYELKGVVENVMKIAQIDNLSFESVEENCLTQGMTANILINGKKLGVIGRIADDVFHRWDIKFKEAFFAQIDLELLYSYPIKVKRFESLPEFPVVVRDLSLAVKQEITASNIQGLIQEQKTNVAPFLRSADLVEEYRGEKLPAGMRSLTFSLKYQSLERTLRDEEVGVAHEKICNVLIEKLGATRR